MLMSSTAKSVPGDLLLFDLTIKTTTYNRKTTPVSGVLYIYIYIHKLDYKIKSLTLLKQINLKKKKLVQTSPATRYYRRQQCLCIALRYRNIGTCVERCFISSVKLR